MKKNIAKSMTSVFALLLVLLTVSFANAQSWTRRYTKPQVDNIIRRVEDRTDRFVRQFDNSLDNSRLNDTRR